MQIEIPFKKFMKRLILTGRKIATTRTHKYGVVGDTFNVEDEIDGLKTYCLIEVKKIEYTTIALEHFHEEGFECPYDFSAYYEDLHRNIPSSDALLWFHKFKEVKG